ncbi:MAG: DUF1800 domain-containing protein [SAR202 cluster bacterium]|nr:DUF1800 domain-containing protein [SAR202 cluster bacterium]
MAGKDIALMAHLMRRAGFGATREELERRVAAGYEATVEELVDPEGHGIAHADEDVLYRHHPASENAGGNPLNGQLDWTWRLITSPRPLEEKMALFWHCVFATGNAKVDHCAVVMAQIEMFRKHGMGSYKDLLVRLAKDPAMIFWLDNLQNHKGAPNENWGRELLELFSMGQGNYTEKDVKEASRAFTGWTIQPSLPRMPYQRFPWIFEYKADDHDDEEKMFLGHKGNFNGEDIIDIICKQPATARFVARHMYNFFVADEVQVPSWLDVPPKDSVAINILASTLMDTNWDIRQTLRVLFNSDFFKDEKVWFSKVKSPAELVTGVMRFVGDYRFPGPGIGEIGQEPRYQGQALLDPPSVEGWHTGAEWIDSGALVRRVNFAANWLGKTDLPGVKSIVDRLETRHSLTAEELVDGCLELLGPLTLEATTRQELIDHVKQGGTIRRGATEKARAAFASRVGELLQLIAATREYQFC